MQIGILKFLILILLKEICLDLQFMTIFSPINNFSTDIDECLEDGHHICDQNCVNTPGSYICTCMPGYILGNDNWTCHISGMPSFYSIIMFHTPISSFVFSILYTASVMKGISGG